MSRSPRSRIHAARVVLGLPLCLLLSLWSAPAMAFDYLEHAFFTDDACSRTQRLLLSRLVMSPSDELLLSKYLALAMMCPERWDRPYCEGGYKQLQGNLNRLKSAPYKSHDYSVTLGDYAALPDHLSRFGPIKNLPRAQDDGLVAQTFEWMAGQGSAGGVIEDVAEDACETQDLSPWKTILEDIEAYLGFSQKTHAPLEVPADYLTPLARAPIPQGPSDPAGVYSFDNPHYLDLVLRNHHHFGQPAFTTWLGFHGAAVQISARPCEQIFALEPDLTEELASGIPGLADVDWDDLKPDDLARRGCAVLKVIAERRLQQWAKRADPTLIAPVKNALMMLKQRSNNAVDALARDRLLDRVVTSLASLVFEGSGLHFLQDGLASGHMRTIRTRGGLQEVRYDHNRDNREGVVAVLRTRQGAYPFVAFGDTYLLGPAFGGRRLCQWSILAALQPTHEEISTCLIQHQRGLLTATTIASILDWALGGTLYGSQSTPAEGQSPCDALPDLERFICAQLPSRPTLVAGDVDGLDRGPMPLLQGSLPVPPPAFSYESLSTKLGMDVAGDAMQIKLDLAFLEELDDYANWLTSYRVGLGATLGRGDRDQWLMDFGYQFHWRWAARFTIDAGMSAYVGFRGFQREDIDLFMGLSPVVGLTILPEGWIKMPLELSISYRAPVTFLNSSTGFFGGDVFEGNWLYVGFGLAFLR